MENVSIVSIKKQSESVINVIKNCANISPIIPAEFLNSAPFIFDFTANNKELAKIDLNDKNKFINYIGNTLKQNGCLFGIGGYGEDRTIYRRSGLFDDKAEKRSIHLGVDIWMPEGTPVYCPLPAIIHSFKNNDNFGDYGGTIILEHRLEGVKFYTLFGHLSRMSLMGLEAGMEIKGGRQIATLGSYDENGNWPPHLHFQIISDMLGKEGDFPGVAAASEKEYYLSLCPDPNLVLRIGNR